MKKILITGGAGFIGSHLSDAYLAAGWNVTAVDDLSTGSRENLAGALGNERFELIEGDVCDDDVTARAMRGCDAVVHLAARIGLKLVIESPLKTLEANVKGTEMVLRHATPLRVPTLIASTSEVYGLATKFPSNEDDPITFGSPTKGRWSYACSKAYDESLALAHHRESGLPAIVVRLFNTVGPRQSTRYGMVLPRFVRQALAGEPLTVYGDGAQTRCFGHVRDVVRGIAALLDEPRAVGDVFNLGNPAEISIRDLAEAVIAATGSTSTIEYTPFDRAYGDGFEEIMKRIPDITKISALVGFRPQDSAIGTIIGDIVAAQRALLVTDTA